MLVLGDDAIGTPAGGDGAGDELAAPIVTVVLGAGHVALEAFGGGCLDYLPHGWSAGVTGAAGPVSFGEAAILHKHG